MKTTRLFRLVPVAFILSLLTGPIFISCTNDDLWVVEDDSEIMTISVDQSSTRTANDGNSTVWSEGDALSVFHSTVGGNTFWSSWFGYFGGNMFQGSVSRLSSSNDWYAVYPYMEENKAANEVHFVFPSRQVQTGNSNKLHFSGEQFPMFGKKANVSRSDELNLTMKNLLSAAEFKVTNTTDYPIVIKEIEFTGPSYIAGGFKVDLTSDEPVLTTESGLTKTVKLTVMEGQDIAPGENALFYMALAPFEVPAGGKLQIKVVAEASSNPGTNILYYHTYDLASGGTFTSGLVKTVNVSFDDHSSQNPDAGSAGEVELDPGEQPEDGTYLLVYDNGENSLAFAPLASQESNKYAIPVTVVDGVVIPNNGEDLSIYAVTIENTGNKHACDDNAYAYDVKNSEDYYIFYSEDVLRIEPSNQYTNSQGSANYYYHTFVQYEDGIQVRSAQNSSGAYQYLLTYSTSKGFHYSRDESDQGEKLHLYLLGGSVKERQTPYFSQERVEYDFDELKEGPLTNAPTLIGAMTTVTYSSSNDSVATVDESGNVTIHKAGTATITATAAADDFYYGATAQYLIVSSTSEGTVFYRVTEFTADEQYIIVSGGKALTNNNGTIGATDISAAGDEILVSDAASMTWTAAASGSGFTLVNNGYYVQRASSSGGGKPNLSNSPNTSYYVWTYSNNRMSTAGSSTSYYLYYNSGWSQTSTSSSAGTVTIFSSTKPLTKQTLKFTQSSVAWVIGEGYELNGTYDFPQTVSGNITPVTYNSSNTSVATISNNRIKIISTGFTTITARTEGDDEYAPAEASYTLRINNKAPDGFIDLGTINLENSSVKNYLDNGTNDYTDDNYSSTTHVATYAPSTSGSSSSSRVDIPNPVSLDWGTASSGTATITVYNDQALTDVVWTWTASKGSTKFDVYNLIPGQTYFCTVVDDSNSSYLYKATFNTEGRRRMLKVSDTRSANNANNCRDLGGMITKDGTKRIKYGMIYRGTNLSSTTADEKKLLAEFMNIGLDNDLRDGSGGGSSRDNPFQNSSYSVAYCGPGYTTTISEWPSGTYTSTGVDTGSGSGYGGWGNTGNANYLTNPVRAYQTMQAFIDAAKRGKASYFHCYIGSDRTGYWGLVIEGLLGVSARDCSIDFELTSFANSVTSGNRTRNSGTYKDGMNFFKGKSYYSTYANDVDHQLENTITHYFVNEVGQYIVDHRSEILAVYPQNTDPEIYQLFQNFTIDGFAADIELFKSLLLEDI